MLWTTQFDELQAYAHTFEPTAKLVAVRWLKRRIITVAGLILIPAGYPSELVRDRIPHECRHIWQQREVGLFKWLLLYLFVLPILWNPWRADWEIDAEAAYWRTLTGPDRDSRIGDSARELAAALASRNYGWAMPAAEAQQRCAAAVGDVS